MNENFMDVLEIRDKIERWVVYRDSFMWDDFREVWHPDGVMKAIQWPPKPLEEFIETIKEGSKPGLNIMHNLGGSAIKVNGNRGLAMTKFIILQRSYVDGILCDVSCYGRQYDLWEKRDGNWGLVYRETIADKDRIDPVNSNESIVFDEAILSQFPVEYCHMAYLQTKAGFSPNKDAPRLSGGAALDALFKKGEDWLAGR